jgi:hypothetical protein
MACSRVAAVPFVTPGVAGQIEVPLPASPPVRSGFGDKASAFHEAS